MTQTIITLTYADGTVSIVGAFASQDAANAWVAAAQNSSSWNTANQIAFTQVTIATVLPVGE